MDLTKEEKIKLLHEGIEYINELCDMIYNEGWTSKTTFDRFNNTQKGIEQMIKELNGNATTIDKNDVERLLARYTKAENNLPSWDLDTVAISSGATEALETLLGKNKEGLFMGKENRNEA